MMGYGCTRVLECVCVCVLCGARFGARVAKARGSMHRLCCE